MPSLIETAYLIECTYKLSSNEITEILKQVPNWQLLTEHSGSLNFNLPEQTASSLNSTLASGYLGRAYINSTDKEIIIVHRGTKLKQTTRGRTDDLVNDGYLAIKSLPPYAELAVQFSQNCLALRDQYSDYRFYQVGHSLGGALAHICGVQLKMGVIAIDPPGCETVLKEFGMVDLVAQLKQHHTFLVRKNLTNAVDRHSGSLYYLGEESKQKDPFFFKSVSNTSEHKMQVIIKKIETGQCAQFDPFSSEKFSFNEGEEQKVVSRSRCSIL